MIVSQQHAQTLEGRDHRVFLGAGRHDLARSGAILVVLGQRAGAHQRQAHLEAAAPARLGLRLDLSAHQLDKGATDRQSQARAAEPAGDGGVGLAEALEQMFGSRLVKSDAGVLHLENQGAGLARLVRIGHLDLDPHFALGGELHRIGEQVRQHLLDPDVVADEVASGACVADHREAEPLFLGLDAEDLHHRIELGPEVEGARFDLQPAGLDLGKVEHVRDQPLQRHARAFDQRDHLALGRRQIGLGQGGHHPDHAIQRRADLVAHVGEEVALGAVGGFGHIAGGRQFLFRPHPADGDRGHFGGGLHEAKVVRTRAADALAIDGEGADHLALGSADRLGPAGGQASALDQVLDRGPERIGLDILDDDPLVAEGRHRARADVRSDRRGDHCVAIGRRQAGRGGEVQPLGLLVQQIDAASDVGRFFFHRLDDRFQHLAHGGSHGDQRHDPAKPDEGGRPTHAPFPPLRWRSSRQYEGSVWPQR